MNSSIRFSITSLLIFTSKVAFCYILSFFAFTGCSNQGSGNQSGPQTNRSFHNPSAEEPGSSPAATPSRESAPAGSNNARILSAAHSALGESSAAGPDGGNLACAWMVNRILQRSVGYRINGDSTASMHQQLESRVRQGLAERIPIDSIQPGDIIISPTRFEPTRSTGHVGIMGRGGQIYENSSSQARWIQRRGVSGWRSYYESSNKHGGPLRTYAYRIMT